MIFIEINLPKKRNFLCGVIYKHPHLTCQLLIFLKTYVTPFLEKLNTEEKLCFLMGDFNTDLTKSNFTALRAHDFSRHLFFNSQE